MADTNRFNGPEGSSGYDQLRARLRAAEVALADERERVAAWSRQVPQGPELPDHVLHDVSEGQDVHLSDLFDDRGALVVYHLPLVAGQDECCPSCALWLDALNGAADQVMDNARFVVVARAKPDRLALWALRQGWSQLRVLSSAPGSFDRDLGFAGADDAEGSNGSNGSDGSAELGLSVLVRGADGQVRLFYAVKAVMEDAGWRHNDLFSPVWQALDLLPRARERAVRRPGQHR